MFLICVVELDNNVVKLDNIVVKMLSGVVWRVVGLDNAPKNIQKTFRKQPENTGCVCCFVSAA